MVEITTIYIVISIISILSSINLYKKFKILDKPNSRKIHISPTPLSGGFAFLLFISFFFVYYLMNFKELNSSYLVCLKLIKWIIKGIDTANKAHRIDGDKNVILQQY